MESAKYHHLSELPEPDYFELEIEKIYGPPPSRLSRLRTWARRNVCLVACLALFLVVAVLWMSAKTALKPTLLGILRPDATQLKQAQQAGVVDEAQVPEGLWAAASPHDDTQQDHVTLDVSGSDVTNADGDDTVLGAPGGNSTNVLVSPGDDAHDASQEDNDAATQPSNHTQTPEAAQDTSKSAPPAQQPTQQPTPAPAPAKQPTVQEDTGKVSISQAAPPDAEPYVPIRATFYSSVEGPKACRGHPVAIIDLPKPAADARVATAPQCFNFANQAASGCATFKANKADGCVARVYAELDCQTYANTMAFMPEDRPVGGRWRSVLVQCAVPEPDPATLGKPPFADQMMSVVDNDAKKGG